MNASPGNSPKKAMTISIHEYKPKEQPQEYSHPMNTGPDSSPKKVITLHPWVQAMRTTQQKHGHLPPMNESPENGKKKLSTHECKPKESKDTLKNTSLEDSAMKARTPSTRECNRTEQPKEGKDIVHPWTQTWEQPQEQPPPMNASPENSLNDTRTPSTNECNPREQGYCSPMIASPKKARTPSIYEYKPREQPQENNDTLHPWIQAQKSAQKKARTHSTQEWRL